ncbi:MAG: putative lipid II flippase FtsW [Neomegalonema sp.]|nr:putative lipid II flippase FtsW [Neomegalonema sp.]
MASSATMEGGKPDLGWINGVSADEVNAEPESLWSEWSRTVDHWTIRACMALFGAGVVLACATSPDLAKSLSERHEATFGPFQFAVRHLLFVLPAFLTIIALSFLSARGVRRVGTVLAVFGLISLIIVLFAGVEHGKSARRWFSLLGLSIQPSEFAKPGLIVVSAWLLAAIGQTAPNTARWAVLTSSLIAALFVFLLILQPDYGQSTLIIAVWAAMYFAAGGSILALSGLGVLAGLVGVVAYYYEPHFASRINSYLFADATPHTQIAEAQHAIASGGWFGLGIGEGVRKASLPDAHADFVIAVAAEELGFLAVALVIFFFAAITLRTLRRAAEMSDPFARLAALGLALLIGLQAAVHLGVSAQILPATGMTLPFISYGGSSMVATGIAAGLMLALTRRAESEA